MYPDVFVKFARGHWDGVDVLPTPQFFYGMEPASEVNVELEPGKALIVKFLTVGEPRPDGTRTVFFELNGQPREVIVRDCKLEAKAPLRPKADPAHPGQIGAPIPGVVSTVAVELNEKIKKGDRLLVMEAMKMQSTVYSPVGGTVKQVLVKSGQHVESKDLLLVIE
jgi:pyruvate carboxylase